MSGVIAVFCIALSVLIGLILTPLAQGWSWRDIALLWIVSCLLIITCAQVQMCRYLEVAQ